MTEEVVLFNFSIKVLGCRDLDRGYLSPNPQMGRPAEHVTIFYRRKWSWGWDRTEGR